MIVHQIFAQISEQEVKNIIVCDNYEFANYLARATYGNNAFAVDCLQYFCQIGDRYRDGIFYHIDEFGEETKIPYIPTQEQEVQRIKTDNEDLTLLMADIVGGAFHAQ